jgi:hypothetical protein
MNDCQLPSHRRPAFVIALAIVALLAPSRRAAAEDLIGLYLMWQHDPTTTMTINWVDPYADSSDTVWYRPFESKEWTIAKARQSNVGHMTLQLRRAELTKLKPDTLYEFGIGDSTTDVSHFWRFRTLPARLERPIRFVEGGDMMHSREMVDAMNAQMQRLDPDFAVLGGDIAYENGEYGSRWIDWLQSWTEYSVAREQRLIPMVIGIGNHEVKGGYGGRAPEDAPYFYSLFALPGGRSNYVIDAGDYLSIVMLDSGHSQRVRDQTEWLRETLAARGDQQFLIGAYHYPAYGTEKAPEGGLPIDAPRAIEIREQWVPHFERYGVTTIFEHDHHTFKRSHRIRNHQRDDENGILYLGDGAWGVRPRDVPDLAKAWWLAKAESKNHLWHAELRPDGTARFEAVDVDGQVFDEVELASPRTKPVDAQPAKPPAAAGAGR